MIKAIGRFSAGLVLLMLGAGAGFGILNGGAAGATTTFTVNDAGDYPVSGSDQTCTSTNDGSCTIRAALEASENLDADTTIVVPDPTTLGGDAAPTYTINDELGYFDVNDSGHTVTIQGAGQGVVTIQAATSTPTTTGTIRDLKVETGTTADISGITFQHGGGSGGTGGGLLVCGNLTLSASTVTNNYAEDSGGGIEESSGGNLTLTNATVSDNTTGDEEGGGGIDVDGDPDVGATITVSDSVVSGNTTDSGDGGGIEIGGRDNLATVVNIENSHIDGNFGADSEGAGLSQDAESTLTVTNTTISDNAPVEVPDLNGGGVYLDGDGSPDTFTGDTIDGNQSDDGGGVYIDGGTPTFSDTTISGNSAYDGAAGVYDDENDSELLAIDSSTVSGNTVLGELDNDLDGDGGGLASVGCNLIRLTNDTITANTSTNDGGGYYSLDCTPDDSNQVRPAIRSHGVPADQISSPSDTDFLFDTITDNSAGASGAGGNIEIDDHSTSTLTDSIVAGGTSDNQTEDAKVAPRTASPVPANCEFDGDQTFTSGGYNLIDDSTCGTPGTGDIIGQSPQLGALGNNGGPTQTELPASTSPAIGAVPTASCDGITTDQRGQARPQGQNNTCTIGSVEVSNVVPPPTNFNGYRLAAKDGGAFDFGIQFGGSLANQRLNAPIVGLANEPGPYGYLMVGSDGGVFSFGGARFFGSLGGQKLASPISGIATTPDGGGYWLVSQAGTVYNFGDAPPLAALSGVNKPIVGIATDLSGKGAWLVGSDGGVFALGDAPFEGSLGNLHLNAPIVGIAPSPSGNGYVLAASDGGVFAFPNALYHGSAATIHLNAPVVGIAETHSGNGYWLVASDGGVFTYGDAPFLGSMGAIALNAPIVGIQHLGAGATG
jgi:hypothetical protein